MEWAALAGCIVSGPQLADVTVLIALYWVCLKSRARSGPLSSRRISFAAGRAADREYVQWAVEALRAMMAGSGG